MTRQCWIYAALGTARRVALIAAVATQTLALSCPAGAQTISDSNFPVGSWNLAPYKNIPTSWVAIPGSSGGNPGPARDVINFVGPVGASGVAVTIVMGVNIYTASPLFSPTTSSPIRDRKSVV